MMNSLLNDWLLPELISGAVLAALAWLSRKPGGNKLTLWFNVTMTMAITFYVAIPYRQEQAMGYLTERNTVRLVGSLASWEESKDGDLVFRVAEHDARFFIHKDMRGPAMSLAGAEAAAVRGANVSFSVRSDKWNQTERPRSFVVFDLAAGDKTVIDFSEGRKWWNGVIDRGDTTIPLLLLIPALVIAGSFWQYWRECEGAGT